MVKDVKEIIGDKMDKKEEGKITVPEVIEESEMPVPMEMPTGDISPNMLIQMAVAGNASIEKLEKLMDLNDRHEAKEAKKAFTVAMTQFRAGCPTISKDQNVSFETSKGKTEYNHAGLSGTIEQVKELMTKCGLSHGWRTDHVETGLKVTCILSHVLGHSEETSLVCAPDSSGGKNPIQALGSTQTYLERYTLFAILGLASAEDDDGGGGPDDSGGCSFDETEDITAGLIELGSISLDENYDADKEEEKFLDKLGAKSISEMTHDQYLKGLKMIEAKKDWLEKQRENA